MPLPSPILPIDAITSWRSRRLATGFGAELSLRAAGGSASR